MLKNKLIPLQGEVAVDVRGESIEEFVQLLLELRGLTVREEPLWNKWYLLAIDRWVEGAGGGGCFCRG